MIQRILIILLGILALVCAAQFGVARAKAGVFGRQKLELVAARDALAASESARKRAEHSLVLQARKNAATARESASATASLQAATHSEPAWADERVPEAVVGVFK